MFLFISDQFLIVDFYFIEKNSKKSVTFMDSQKIGLTTYQYLFTAF